MSDITHISYAAHKETTINMTKLDELADKMRIIGVRAYGTRLYSWKDSTPPVRKGWRAVARWHKKQMDQILKRVPK